MKTIMEEIITSSSNNRYSLFPIRYLDIWEKYKEHEDAFWTAREIDMSIDKKQWNELSEGEQKFITNVLAFFANSDTIVLENLLQNFCREVTIPEARCFYQFQGMMENIHTEVYNLMIDTFIDDQKQKNQLFRAMDTIPCIKRKADWALKWIHESDHRKSNVAKRLFAFGVVEGLFFSGSFCAIFWLKEKGKLINSLGKSNEWIARDETLHTNFAILLYTKYVSNKLTEDEAHGIMRDALEIEEEFICDSLTVSMIGMNSDLMKQYVRFVADRLLVQFGYRKIYFVENPFPFMTKISLDGKTNFFEQRVSEYNLAGKISNSDLFALDNLESKIF